MKILFLLVWGLIINFSIYADILPEEYYEIKKQIPEIRFHEGAEYLGGRYPNEEDIEVAKKLIPFLDIDEHLNKKIKDERSFIFVVLHVNWPLEEYDNDSSAAIYDRFEKLPEEKKKYYKITLRWMEEEFKHYWMHNNGVSEDVAEEVVDAVWDFNSSDRKTEGVKKCKKLFDKGVYNLGLVTHYLTKIPHDEIQSERRTFFDRHFERMKTKDLAHQDLFIFLSLLKRVYREDKDFKAVDRLLDKIEENNDAFAEYKKTKELYRNMFLKYLIDEKNDTDLKTKGKIIRFLNQNKYFLEDVEDYKDLNTLFKSIKKFVIENSEELNIGSEVIEKMQGESELEI